jgi:hypothetical protein
MGEMDIACYTILPKKPGNFTAKAKYDQELFKMELAALEQKDRNSLRSISRKLSVPFTTVQQMIGECEQAFDKQGKY